MRSGKRHATAVAIAAFLVPYAVEASPITFTGSDADGRAASITFDTSGTNLLVALTNTATYDSRTPTDILTGVFFDLAGNLGLDVTTGSVTLAAGSTVKGNDGLTDYGHVVGGEWAYLGGGSVLAYGAHQGISSAGLGVFGPGDRFPGSNLQGPESPNGVQYGITTSFDLESNDNGGLSGSGLIANSVLITLPGLLLGFNPFTAISNVTFQYGTSLSEPSIPGCRLGQCAPIVVEVVPLQEAPEPASLILLGTGLGFIARMVGRRRHVRH